MWTSVLEQRDLDGELIKKVELGTAAPIFEQVFYDGEALYVYNDNGIARIDTETLECSQAVEIDWNIGGDLGDETGIYYTINSAVYQNKLLLHKRSHLIESELISLELPSGKQEIVDTWEPGEQFSYYINEAGKSYYADVLTGDIRCYDITTKTDTLVTSKFADPENINVEMVRIDLEDGRWYNTYYSDAQGWNLIEYDGWILLDKQKYNEKTDKYETTVFAYNLQTEEVKEITLRDYYSGIERSLEIMGLTSRGLFVVEETRSRTVRWGKYDVVPFTGEVDYSVYAFIQLDDYINSKPNFETIIPLEYESA